MLNFGGVISYTSQHWHMYTHGEEEEEVWKCEFQSIFHPNQPKPSHHDVPKYSKGLRQIQDGTGTETVVKQSSS